MTNLSNALINLGISPEKAAAIGNQVALAQTLVSVNASVTAAGTVIGDATALTAIANHVTTAAAATGVKLPACEIGGFCEIRNSGANTMNVFPDSSSNNINGGSAGAAITMATNTAARFRKVSSTKWIQLG